MHVESNVDSVSVGILHHRDALLSFRCTAARELMGHFQPDSGTSGCADCFADGVACPFVTPAGVGGVQATCSRDGLAEDRDLLVGRAHLGRVP